MKTELDQANKALQQLERDFSMWEITFSSEFDFDDTCAKFKPCYIDRQVHEVGESEVEDYTD